MNTPRGADARPSCAKALARSQGVTLIELMVGMAIGLITTLAIAQVLIFAEGQKRTTTGGSDAQASGSLGLYTIQRDVQMAGYGLTTSLTALGCEIRARYQEKGSGPVKDFIWTLAPVTIADGSSGASDTITVLGSNKAYSVPYRVTVDHPRTAANFFVASSIGVSDGDLMIAVPATIDASNWCSIFDVTGTGGSNQVIHDSGTAGPWNQPGGSTIFPLDGYPAGSYLVNLGQLIARTYSISAAQSLQVATFDTVTAASSTDDLFPQVVNLQAMYGKDTDGDGVVDTYDNETPIANAGWREVLNVRIALVARSATYDRDEVTKDEPVWNFGAAATVAGSTDCGGSRCVKLKLTDLADWKHYRYKVFETVVPIRNMLWRL